MELAGAHAIVTGGSSGIGLATASLLRERGARVSLIARDPHRLAAAAARVGGDTLMASVDVTDAPALQRAIDDLVDEAGPCDVLVASAGEAQPGYFEELELAQFHEQMELDYFGTLHAIRAVVPAMRTRNRGAIVAISSTAALIGVFGYTAYAPAKAAVRGLMETLRAELAPHGILVACAYPPDTDTPGLERENQSKPPETVAVSGPKPLAPARVAAAIVRGIERDHTVITADPLSAVLARVGGLVAPITGRVMDHQVRRSRPS